MLVALGFAAFAAVAVVLTTAAVIIAARRDAAASEAALETYKAGVVGKIADAKREGIKAGKTAGDAEVKAAQANERAAGFEKDAETLRLQVAQAQLALEKFKAPRSVSAEGQKHITEAVASFAGQQFCGMVAGSVLDARFLWRTIDKLLREAKWERVQPWGLATGDPPAGVPLSPNDGVTVFFPKDSPELWHAGKALVDALNNSGVKAYLTEDSGPQQRAKILVIEIGTKPV